MKTDCLPQQSGAQASRPANGLRIIACLALALLGAWFAFIGRFHVQRGAVERSYEAAGYTMKPGCNAGAAVKAKIDLWSISNQIEAAQGAPIPDTTELRRLQQDYEIAQKELAFREEDCRKRGHAGTIPVKRSAKEPRQSP